MTIDISQLTRYRRALVCSQESLEAVQRWPTPTEAPVIEEYRLTYKEAVGYYPHGLHYIPFPSKPEPVAIWFPPSES